VGQSDPQRWIFAVVSGDPLARTSLSRVCDALAVATGHEITPEILSSYGALGQEMERGRVTLGWAPPLVARQLIRSRAAVAVSCPERTGGTVYHSVLFARARGRVKTARDLRGARAAWVDPSSLSGFMLARRWCERQGIDPETAFSFQSHHKTHSAVARAVLDSKADVGATYANIDRKSDRIVDAGWSEIGVPNSEIHVIATIGPIPADAIVLSSSVNAETRERCARALSSLEGQAIAAARSLFRAERFAPAPTEYARLLEQFVG